MQRSVTLVLALSLAAPVMASPEKAARFYEDALEHYEKNDLPAATIQLKNALQQDRKMLAAHLLLGKVLLRNSDLKGAEAALEEALKQGVSRGEVALPLGQVYLALGRPEAVIERISANGLPTALQVEVLTMRGNAYAEAGNTQQAFKSFEEARALDPKSVSPLIAEIPILLGSGQLEKARSKADMAFDLAPENAYVWNMKASVLHASFDMVGALAAYDKALALNPKHVDARVARAGLLIDLKREADARKDLDFLLTVAPDDPRAAYLRALLASQQGNGPAITAALGEVTRVIDALPPAWVARREQLLMAGALAHHGLGNLEKAREYLDIIIFRNARNLGAKKLLASIYIDTKDYSRALPLLESLQKIAPEDPQVMFLLGSVHMAQRRYLQATELLERAVERTGSPDMNRVLAFSQLSLGRDVLGQASLEKAFAANPNDAQSGTALTMLYMRQSKSQKALQTAGIMVKHAPENLTILNFLGSVKGTLGDMKGARAAYINVLDKNAEFRPALLSLARLDVAEKRFEEARKRLDGMLKKRHDDSDVLFLYGLLEQRAGRISEAVRLLQKASDVQRSDIRPALALIDLQLKERQNDQALKVAKTLASMTSDNLAVQLALSRSFLAVGDKASARGVLIGATRLADYDADMQVLIARMQLAAGNPDGAGYNVLKALQGRPGDPVALALMVEVEALRGDSSKADEALKVLVSKHPNLAVTAVTRAHLAMSRGQYASAVTEYRKALLREESGAVALALARAHLAAGEPTKAVSFLDGWVKKHPRDLSMQIALAESQFRAGQLAAARQTYAKVLKVVPDDAVTLNNYANLLQKLNDPEAQQVAEKAFRLSPDNSSYADTLGWILVRKGQLEVGLHHLREARLRSPENYEIRFHLAYALSKVGRNDEARNELRAALDGPGRLFESVELNQLKKDLGL